MQYILYTTHNSLCKHFYLKITNFIKCISLQEIQEWNPHITQEVYHLATNLDIPHSIPNITTISRWFLSSEMWTWGNGDDDDVNNNDNYEYDNGSYFEITEALYLGQAVYRHISRSAFKEINVVSMTISSDNNGCLTFIMSH